MSNPYAAFMEDDFQGTCFQNALRMLAAIDPDKLRHAISQIEKETAAGPLMDPTAYLDGSRFDNARNYRATFELAIPLVEKLKEIMG